MQKNKLKKKLISIALSALTAFSSGAVAFTAALSKAAPAVILFSSLTAALFLTKKRRMDEDE